ncbi:MAG: polysulfide reductase NrfD [Actinobacteria bacterium]|nr:polysulfide reductase NrfD [Actinomycetota bacterium]
MQEPITVDLKTTNRQLFDFVMRTPLWFFNASGALSLILAVGLGIVVGTLWVGLQIFGYSHPVYWAFLIVNFVFWIGISHAGVMISAILRLTQAEWRRPVTRAAEILTVFSLMTAMLHPVIHSGRAWRTLYWAFPYDFMRGMWPNPRSPLVWDPSAIFTYLTSTILFIYVALLPDLAMARDRAPDVVRRFAYSVLSMGFRGTTRQWRIQGVAGILLSALILPIFVSVHSIVSWDFAVTGVPGWHNTVFAPYFVIGAVHSGVSAVVTIMIILRYVFKLQNFITRDHIDALARLLIAVATTWFFFLMLDFMFGLYGTESVEVDTWQRRLFTGAWSTLAIIFILCAFVIPVPMWLFRRVRRSFFLMFLTTILVNIGMWIERFMLIVPGLERKSNLTFQYSTFTPTFWEIAIVLSMLALPAIGLLTFAKVFPIMPAADIREGQVVATTLRIGRANVPATMRE